MTVQSSQNGTEKRVLKVLLRIDEQIDFMPGGALAVKDGDKIVAVSNELARSGYYDLVVDSMDDHPADHGSFASQHPGKDPAGTVSLNGVEQQLWPDHCVHASSGGEFHPDLDRSMVARTFMKGQDKRVDSYSAFYDNGRGADTTTREQHNFLGQSTGLADYLRARAQEAGADSIQVDIVGLAVPYCVTYSARDARDESYQGRPFVVRVIADGVKGIEHEIGDFERDLEDLRTHGISVIESKDVFAQASVSG